MSADKTTSVLIESTSISSGKEIGRGAYGRVFEVDYEGTACAAKEIHSALLEYAYGDQIQNLKDNFLHEWQIWSTLRHPNVVQFLGVYYPVTDQHQIPVMVMEKMLCSLKGFVEEHNNIPLSITLSILGDICLGLRYLHTRTPPIIHRDLTPNNILLNHSLEAKITDLGVARVMQTVNSRSAQTMTQGPGTAVFMPPECTYAKSMYGLPIDVFSFGGVILFTTARMWPEPGPLMETDDSGEIKYFSEVQRRQHYLDNMTEDAAGLKQLAISCLDSNPKRRPPIAEISMEIKHLKDACDKKYEDDWMNSIVWWAKVLSQEEGEEQSQQQINQSEVTLASKEVQTEDTVVTFASVDVQTVQTKVKAVEVQTEKKQDIIRKEAPPLAPALRSKRYKIKWTKLADLPVPLSGIYAVADDMKIYVTGCLSPEDYRFSYHEVYVYDCSSNQWDCLPRSGHYFGVPYIIGGKLVLIGGRLSATDKKTNKVSTFDPSTQHWISHYPDMLSARSRPGVASYLEYVIVLGGGVEDPEKVALDTIEILNYIDNLQWREVSLHLPIPMWRTTPTVVDDQLYIVNFNYKKTMQEAYMISVPNMLQLLDRNDLKFTKLDTPATFAAAVLTNFSMPLVFGGSKNNISTTDVLIYDTTTKSWEKLDGSLSEARSFAAVTAVTGNAIIIIGGYRYYEDSSLSKCLTTVELGQAELSSF